MASSRPSSPASSGGSPEPPTPHSKIKALLAAVEGSDDEDDAETAKKTGSSYAPQSDPDMTAREDGESDESDVAIRPRGRLASRMQGAAVTAIASENTTVAPERARERVKTMLGLEEAEAEAQPTRHGDAADTGDEDDGLPLAPRRLKRRAPKESTPGEAEPSARPPSPGLFFSSPMRPSPAKGGPNKPDSDNDLPAIHANRFKALVERKKQERLAREAAEEARQAERRERQEQLASELEQTESDDGDNDSGITDDEGGRRLTQNARPMRKASKKAIDEMNRETQRMARNMQLAPEAKTRKKITTATLFERFNFRPATGYPPEPKANSSSRPTTPQTDVEMRDADTPPSSPPTVAEYGLPHVESNTDMHGPEDDELPSLNDVMDTAGLRLHKGKGKASAIDLDEKIKTTHVPRRRVRVRLPVVAAKASPDDELEIKSTVKDKIDAVLNSIPAERGQESRSLKVLRALAQVKSPGKESRREIGHPGMTAVELRAQLFQKARQQARLERDHRLEMLKAQGVVIQTADERERQEQEVEDLVTKAREEAQKIMKQERAAAKHDKKGGREADTRAWDDSEDEEYDDSANEADGEASAIELSGSEDEDEQEDEQEDEHVAKTVLDEDAKSGDSEIDEKPDQEEQQHDESDDESPVIKQRRPRKQTAILSDDDPEVEATPNPKMMVTHMTPATAKTTSPAVPTSVLRSARKTFIPGLPVYGPAGLGLTQIFEGTMDDSQMSPPGGPTQSMMPDFDQFPDSNFSATAEEPAEDMIMDSQREESLKATQYVQLNLSQSQMHGLDSLLPDRFNTQMSEMIEPSQDGGLQDHTPLRDRFVEPPFSTVETVAADQENVDAAHDSPLVRRGRLRRKMDMSTVEEEPTQATVNNAFNSLLAGARTEKNKRLVDEFDRKKTKAKEMVEEQADESEDEYAGLGGADGEESDNESAGSLQEIIDDGAGNDVDEGELAAFYADRERANDEKEVEKLFKDITTGALRRKRGADYDLSDSDDGGEARRRMKRRQFAKMQRALYTDERVKKMAENPGNQAFLRTIEDRGSDEEIDCLDVKEASEQEESQSQSQDDGDAGEAQQQQTIPDSQPVKLASGAAEQDRTLAHMRRTNDGKKACNIVDVREALSNLLEERQGSVIPATEAGSDGEEDDDHDASPVADKENRAPSPRRRHPAIVDRINLKRNASSSTTLGVSKARLAFAAQQASSSSFKVPALLRRATTNSTLVSTSSSSTAGSAGGFGEETKIRRAPGKMSGVNGFASNSAQSTMERGTELRRELRKVRGATLRIGVVDGLLGKGSFE